MKKKKDYDLAVVIGRFQPFHRGHEMLVKEAGKIADKVLVLIGSSFKARNIKDPFTYQERSDVIKNVFKHEKILLETLPLRDYLYNENLWHEEVQKQVKRVSETSDKICIVGHEKDQSSYYLHSFNWEFIEIDSTANDSGIIHSTDIRDEYFGRNLLMAGVTPPASHEFLYNFADTEDFENLFNEYQFIKKYKEQFDVLPYPPTFNTVDAVVICMGHVLMVKRKANPGKGLWALAGGFLDQNETIKTAIIRELVEETKIRGITKDDINQVQYFDSPNRSLRGRTITHAGLIVLNNRVTLPKVKGSDDAEKAKWIPFAEFHEMGERIYEDHKDIVNYFIGRS